MLTLYIRGIHMIVCMFSAYSCILTIINERLRVAQVKRLEPSLFNSIFHNFIALCIKY